MAEDDVLRRDASPIDIPALYPLILTQSRDLIRVVDRHFRFIYVSPSHETVLGYTVDEMMYTPGLNLLHPDDHDVAITMHRDMLDHNLTRDGLFRFHTKDGKWITLETRGRSLVQDGQIIGVVTVGRDVTERRRMEAKLHAYQRQLQFLAFHDPLTGLANRTLFFEEAAHALEAADQDGQGLAVMFIDCDDFKYINDAYGHAVGDQVLQEFGRRLLRAVRPTDLVARVGGDEFMVLLRRIHTAAEARGLARRILQSMQEPWDVAGQTIACTVSMGVALYPGHGRDEHTLMRHADAALYAAKRQGKNTTVVYDARGSTASIGPTY